MSYARHPLEIAQYLTEDAARIAGASPKAVALLIAPGSGALRLSSRNANPGTGRRRLFTGFDVLAIAAAFAATNIGFPQRWTGILADNVVTRAKFRLAGLGMVEQFAVFGWPIPGSDDWARAETWRGGPDLELPEAFHVLRVDALIDRVIRQLDAIIDEKPFPEIVTPVPDIDRPRMLAGMWQRDAQGRHMLAGLTHNETKEIAKLLGKTDKASVTRFWELDAKHRAALEGEVGD
jgi:hypothetical protein